MQDNRYPEQEKIWKLLLKFSFPCVMGLLIGALYNIADQIFIGTDHSILPQDQRKGTIS